MFYRTAEGPALPHSPLNAIVAPRPIGWISTRCSTGDNLAPHSFFNIVAYRPPQVMFSAADRDTLKAVRESGVFAVNVVSRALFEAMNATSAKFPRGTDEFTACGVEKAECQTIDCPRVAAAPASLECTATQFIELEGGGHHMVIGRVEAVHIREEFLRDGRFDLELVQPMARCGYAGDYAEVSALIELKRPD